jgi:hypothetical protein
MLTGLSCESSTGQPSDPSFSTTTWPTPRPFDDRHSEVACRRRRSRCRSEQVAGAGHRERPFRKARKRSARSHTLRGVVLDTTDDVSRHVCCFEEEAESAVLNLGMTVSRTKVRAWVGGRTGGERVRFGCSRIFEPMCSLWCKACIASRAAEPCDLAAGQPVSADTHAYACGPNSS